MRRRMPTRRNASSPGPGRGESRYVCCAAVNNIMEARRSPDYQAVMDQADLVTSDGMPLVWMLRWLGARSATRVYGPDLMSLLLEAAGDAGIPVGFYGGTDAVLEDLVATVKRRFPRLEVVYAEAPPFRELTAEEDRRVDAVDAGRRRADSICRPGESQTRPLDARAQRPRAGGDAGGRRGVRFSGGSETASAPLDAVERTGVDVPAGDGAAASVAAVPDAESEIRGAGAGSCAD